MELMSLERFQSTSLLGDKGPKLLGGKRPKLAEPLWGEEGTRGRHKVSSASISGFRLKTILAFPKTNDKTCGTEKGPQ